MENVTVPDPENPGDYHLKSIAYRSVLNVPTKIVEGREVLNTLNNPRDLPRLRVGNERGLLL